MKITYHYTVYEDCLAATEISHSREKGKLLCFLAWGWILIFSVISVLVMVFGKGDVSSRSSDILFALFGIALSAFHFWYIITRYDQKTRRKVNDAITQYISGNKTFIYSKKKIDSLSISDEVIAKQCMGCGSPGSTQRCFVRKSGHAVSLPLCEKCISHLKSKVAAKP